jgi:hypothetical protein
MEHIKNTHSMTTSLDKNDTLEEEYKNTLIAMKHRESQEGIILQHCLRILNYIAIEFIDQHEDKNYCSQQNFRQLNFKVDLMENLLLDLIIAVIMLI